MQNRISKKTLLIHLFSGKMKLQRRSDADRVAVKKGKRGTIGQTNGYYEKGIIFRSNQNVGP